MVAVGGLDLLISTEARLAEALADAEAEAQAILQAAREAVAAEEAGYAAELAAATEALVARSAEQREAEIARFRSAADLEVRRHEALWRERGEELAALVARRVVATLGPGAPS